MQQHARHCPFCGRVMKPADGKTLIGPRVGPVLACAGFARGCRTYVELDPKTRRPLGRPADPELRQLRRELAEAMRPLWAHADRYHHIAEQGRWRKPVIERLRREARLRAMRFLARELGLRRLDIKRLSKSQCRHAITICQINTYRSILAADGQHPQKGARHA